MVSRLSPLSPTPHLRAHNRRFTAEFVRGLGLVVISLRSGHKTKDSGVGGYRRALLNNHIYPWCLLCGNPIFRILYVPGSAVCFATLKLEHILHDIILHDIILHRMTFHPNPGFFPDNLNPFVIPRELEIFECQTETFIITFVSL